MTRTLIAVALLLTTGCTVTTRYGLEDSLDAKNHYQPNVKAKVEIEIKRQFGKA